MASEAARQTEKAPPRYVCRKNADCNRLAPHCKAHPGGTKCYIDDAHPSMNLDDARKACARIGAKLPTILDYRDVNYLKEVFAEKGDEPIWLSFGFRSGSAVDCALGGRWPDSTPAEDCFLKDLAFDDVIGGDQGAASGGSITISHRCRFQEPIGEILNSFLWRIDHSSVKKETH